MTKRKRLRDRRNGLLDDRKRPLYNRNALMTRRKRARTNRNGLLDDRKRALYNRKA